jgi:hypothetical protein
MDNAPAMNRRSVRSLAFALAVSLVAGWGCAAPARAQIPGEGGTAASLVRITRCSIIAPRPLSHRAGGTQISYVNIGPTLLHRIAFEVRYRTAGTDYGRVVIDAGTFAPNTRVSHRFPLYSDVTFAGSAPLSCRVASAA